MLTLPSGAKNALSVFLSWKAEEGESVSENAPLFVSRQGSRLTRQQAHNIFKQTYNKVGLRGHVTTHSPRKTYAKVVYENSGSDLVVTQRALRHTSWYWKSGRLEFQRKRTYWKWNSLSSNIFLLGIDFWPALLYQRGKSKLVALRNFGLVSLPTPLFRDGR